MTRRSYHTRSWLVLFAGLVLGTTMCGDDPLAPIPEPIEPTAEPGIIEGRVCDPDAGAWLANATTQMTVEDEVLKTFTDGNGHFQFTDIPPGTHSVAIISPSVNKTLEAEVISGHTTYIGDSTCATQIETGIVEGRVCDLDAGAWLANATIQMTVDSELLQTLTDGNGHFQFTDIPPGIYAVDIISPTVNETLEAEVVSGATTYIGDSTCYSQIETGTLKGRVCNDVSGQWVPLAVITLDNAAATSTTCDAMGRFEFVDLIPGDYVLTITATNFDATRTATVMANQTTDIGPLQCQGATGGVSGRICGADNYWLSGARVFVTLNDGSIVETTTDADGYYTLQGLPDGTYMVKVTRGSFFTAFSATVTNGEITDLPEPICIAPINQIAVVTGMFDKVEEVLGDLGFSVRRTYNTMTPVENDPDGEIDIIKGARSSFWIESFLTDPAWMAEYSIIFFNCGLEDRALRTGDAVVGPALANLKDFVANGGSVYASDWASEILRLTFPDRINFYGNDASFGRGRVGVKDSRLPTKVADPGLAVALGRTNLSLNLNLNQWVVMDKLDTQPHDLQIMVTADRVEICDGCLFFTSQLKNTPVVVQFEHQAGRIVFTSAHNEAQTTEDLRDVLNYMVFEL